MEVLGEINNFCRFCLSQENEDLMPLSSAIENSSFSLQDIQDTTGISILESETGYLVACSKCCNRIELAVDFRRSCIKGNVKFLQLFGHIIDKLRSSNFAEENLEDAAYVNNDPLQIDTALQNESTSENACEEHNKSTIPAEELIDKRPTNGQEDFEDGHSSSEDLPLTATKERIMKSEEDIANKPSTSVKNIKRLCGICGALVYNIIDHTRSHTKENLLQCPQCPVQMVNRTNLVRHVRTVHEKVIIKSCEPCGKGFTTDNAYKSHMRTHHNIGEQYQCKICLRIFNHASSRLQHMKQIHFAEWKYECQICQKKFKQPNSLKRHGRVHSTNAPYACSLCPKRFKSSCTKRKHEITHSGIQFACTLCTKVYRYKSLLSMHYRKCHPTECSGELV